MNSAAAVIVAGGSSRRMGFDKLEADLRGKPVLAHSVDVFLRCGEVGEIVLVGPEEKLAGYRQFLEERVAASAGGRPVRASVVAGGAERYRSVSNGLDAVGADVDVVLVHDAARPLLTPETVARCAEAARASGAVSLAHRVSETLKRADDSFDVTGSVERQGLWAMETPQAFRVGLLREAYRNVHAGNVAVTDEVSAVQLLGEKVRLVEAAEPNLKITVPQDLAVAAAVLAARGEAGGRSR